MERKKFLQSLLGASAFFAVPYSAYSKDDDAILRMIQDSSKTTTGNLFGFKVAPIDKVKVGIIGLGNRGTVLLEMFKWLVENNNAEIVALCDLQEDKVSKVTEKLSKWQKTKPKTYFGRKYEWKKLVKQEHNQ